MKDDIDMAYANKQVGQQKAPRKEKKKVQFYDMILAERDSVSAELTGHEKSISRNRQKESIHFSTLILGSPLGDRTWYSLRSNNVRNYKNRHHDVLGNRCVCV